MSRILQIIAFFAVIFGAGLVFAFFSPDATAAPSVQWNPSRVIETLHPGESRDVRVTVKALSTTEAMTSWVVPELQPYVTVSPATVRPLQKDETATLTFSVAAPIDAGATLIDGTVHLRQGLTKRTFSKPLPIQLSIVCPCLPPDPGDAGKATIEGIDSDNDGVRDDVERWIAVTYATSSRMRAAATQVARAVQLALTATTQAEIDAADVAGDRAAECALITDSDNTSVLLELTQIEVLNTIERLRAQDNFDNNFTGRTFFLNSLPSITDCDVPPDSLPN